MDNAQNKSPPKHTPGPWVPYNTVYRPDNFFKVGKDFGGFQCIADCSYETTSGASGEEALANARLIASSPELLEALEQAELTLRMLKQHFDGAAEFAYTDICAAIAKAKGGAA
jgi:hypothetical protein